jgi:hypothetical protein
MSDTSIWESNVLRNLRRAAEARGLNFYVNPSREVLPSFLGDYQPDAIAVGPEGGMIVEVKRRKNQQTDRQLSAIAQRISKEKGWEFRAVYLNPVTNETPPIAVPTQGQLQATLEEIDALIKTGHRPAALLTGWATLESLARLASVAGDGEKSGALSPIQAIQTLAEQGYLENDAADQLRGTLDLRNAVAHGDLSAIVPQEQVETMLGRLRALAADVLHVTTASSA